MYVGGDTLKVTVTDSKNIIIPKCQQYTELDNIKDFIYFQAPCDVLINKNKIISIEKWKI